MPQVGEQGDSSRTLQDTSLQGSSAPDPCCRDIKWLRNPRVLGVAMLQLYRAELGAEGGLICFLHLAEHSPTAAQP